MLNAMRRRVSSFLVTILMGLLIASFAIWGIGDVFRTGGGNVIATVGEARITPSAFSREFENEVRRWQQQLGPEFSAAQARSLGIHRQVLARMVSRISFDQAAHDLGLRASDEQVRRYIAENEAFQNSFGTFDRAIYESILARIGYTPASFEEAVRQDLTRDQLLNVIGQSAHAPDILSELLYTYRAEKREIDILKVARDAIEQVPEPSEDVLRQYYADNEDQFMAPEYRSLAFLMITADDLADDVTVSEDDLRVYYDAHLDEFVRPERRVVEQIVLFDKDQAEQAYRALQDGEDFLAVAKRFAGLSAEDIVLGEKTQQELAEDISPAAAERVFAVKVGSPTQPQQSAFGWHILRATAVIPGTRTTLEQARDQVEREARKEAAIEKLFDLANAIDDELASGGSLDDVARLTGMDITRIEAVDRTGHTPAGEPAGAIPDVPSFLREAFRMEPGAEPLLREFGPDGYYVLSITGVTPRALKPFEEVREAVLANWKVDEQSRRAEERARALAAASNTSSLTELARQQGLTVQEDVVVVRDPALDDSGVATNVREAAFTTAPGSATVTPAADGDGYLVVRVETRIPGDPAADPEKMALLKEAIAQQYGNDVLGAYQAYLERRLGVQLNERLLEDTLTQLIDQPL
ncbi:MAG: hypothetical protein D6763_05025 [Alphaproteobacteria bacterium]|nr:MAG: hypothetical protein D6763_05025 [Alphaproteobacteria bacterium]